MPENRDEINAITAKLFNFETVPVLYTGHNLKPTMNRQCKLEVRAYIKSRTALGITPKTFIMS